MMEGVDKSHILDEIKREKLSLRGDDEGFEKYEELQAIVEQIDLSILDSNDCEIVTSPAPNRRKISRSGSESNDIQLEKHEKEIEAAKQIELVKKALTIIYDMENTNFRRFISKHGKKRRNVSRVLFIKRINDNAQALPLWIGRDDEVPPELCGAREADKNYVSNVGDVVAALVKQDEKENWILAEVVAYDPNRKEYKVDDIYEETKREQTLSWKKIIPLPKLRADPETNPDALFPINYRVLALYPKTTCFYPAIVGELPTKPQDPYKLLFEDETYESGYSSPICVHQRYVIDYRNCGEDEGKASDENS